MNFIRKFKERKRIYDFDVEENYLFSQHESFFYSGFDKVAPVVVRKNYKFFILFIIFFCFVLLVIVLLLFVFKVFRNDIF